MSDTEKPSWEWQQEVDRLTQERDAWHMDASSHLQALCEKQAEVNGLEQQLAQVTQERDDAVDKREGAYMRVDQLAKVTAEDKEIIAVQGTTIENYDRSLAALRQQLEVVQQELASAEMRSVAHLKMYTEASQRLEKVTKNLISETEDHDKTYQQIAVVTQERDEAVRIVKMLTEPSPVTEDDVKWAQEMLAAQKHQEGLP